MKTTIKILLSFTLFLCVKLINAQNNYPLEQVPPIGNKNVTVLIASFEGEPVKSTTRNRINAAVNFFNDYANKISREKSGRIRVSATFSPVLRINRTPSNLGDKRALMREVAAQRGVNINVPYLAYVMFSEDLRSFGGNGIGNGANGFITLGGSNLWIPGIAHEMIHMFSVNHANIREAGSKILGGEIQEGRDPYFFMGSEGDQKTVH